MQFFIRVTTLSATLLISSSALSSTDCWIAGDVRGKSAPSNEQFAFIDDGFRDGMIICFADRSGSVSGNDLPLVRFGESTLIGWSQNGLGLETVNTYQVDRQRRKLFISQSRIGTATMVPLLPDYVAAYVADVVPAQ